VGEAPLTSTSTPARRPAIVAFHTRGFGRYEKIRRRLIRLLPVLGERPYFDVERPGRALLMRDVPHFLGNRGGLGEERVSFWLGEHRPRPLDVDHRIDDDVSDVNPRRPEVARHGFGKNSLRGLRR